MRRPLAAFLTLLLAFPLFIAHSQEISDLPSSEDTLEEFEEWVDSLKRALLPTFSEPVSLDADACLSIEDEEEPIQSAMSIGDHVPYSVSVSNGCAVGMIPMTSGVSQYGSMTASIPIECPEGMRGFSPELFLSYDSRRGNSETGMGWALGGISKICRSSASMYFDCFPSAPSMESTDAFCLDGSRLVSTSSSGKQTETGFVKANFSNYGSGDIASCRPDGTKATYSAPNASSLEFPIASLTDAWGNSITYEYLWDGGKPYISEISYNGGCRVTFSYVSRQDTVVSFLGGKRTECRKFLSAIACSLDDELLSEYTLSYSTQNGRSLLTQVDLSSGGESLNPIRMWYGTGASYSCSTNRKLAPLFHRAANKGEVRGIKGRFNYTGGTDGLATLPNATPYWQTHKDATGSSHSRDLLEYNYDGTESILVYGGLEEEGTFAQLLSQITVGEGFCDLLIGDLSSGGDDFLVKVNNVVDNGFDKITFTVYNVTTYGFAQRYQRSFSVQSAFTDNSGNKSIQPKYYYVGDFNGDGKQDVLAVGTHKTLSSSAQSGLCWVFDLEGGTCLMSSTLLQHSVPLLGTENQDAAAIALNSDRLLVMDVDGDGKTDLCHVNSSGTYVYAFEPSGGNLALALKGSYSGLSRSACADRQILGADFNGDGLCDIALSPEEGTGPATDWEIYYSKGDGTFEKLTVSGACNGPYYGLDGFIAYDVDRDGCADIYAGYGTNIYGYLSRNGKPTYWDCGLGSKGTKASMVACGYGVRNSSAQLAAINDSLISLYSYAPGVVSDVQMTGLSDSFGVIKRISYGLANKEGFESQIYSLGSQASYPYCSLVESIPVVTSIATYRSSQMKDSLSYAYENGVRSLQGKGFLGFSKVTERDSRGRATVREFDPLKFGALVSETSPARVISNSVTAEVADNKTAVVKIESQTCQDLLTGYSSATDYSYDSYGFPVSELTAYSDGITKSVTRSYSNTFSSTSDYHLGIEMDVTETVTRNGYPAAKRWRSMGLRNLSHIGEEYFSGTGAAKRLIWTYDSCGNQVAMQENRGSAAYSLYSYWTYDARGRVLSETDPRGNTVSYAYGSRGEVTKVTDARGNETLCSYDGLGRLISASYPDSTTYQAAYYWGASGGVYSKVETGVGSPRVDHAYDCFNRETRSCDMRFNGAMRRVDTEYDDYGNVSRVSLPETMSSPVNWDTYSYDSYDRPIRKQEASGRTTLWAYSGPSVTETVDGISTKRTYDALGGLKKEESPSGTAVFVLEGDGQPHTVTDPMGVTTAYSYDAFRRCVSVGNPAFGTVRYTYDAAGNLASRANAKGETVAYSYDNYGEVTQTDYPEFTILDSYDAYGNLVFSTSTNGLTISRGYDSLGRIIAERWGNSSGWFRKNYSYSKGKVEKVSYTSSMGLAARESRINKNGNLWEVTLNDTLSIWKVSTENGFGQVTKAVTGPITRNYYFDTWGWPTGREALCGGDVLQSSSLTFNLNNGCLTERTNNLGALTEFLGYDYQNRLEHWNGHSITYDGAGRIASRSDVASFSYSSGANPYMLVSATLLSPSIPVSAQTVQYTSFGYPAYISEGIDVASFVYGPDMRRATMTISGSENGEFVYLGDCYEAERRSSNVKEKIYLMGDAYTAPAVLMRNNSSVEVHWILRDHLGSIEVLADQNGGVEQTLSYDPWGRLRNPSTLEPYAPGYEPSIILNRGFCGHEHLPMFGLVNMNARLYDPALGRFLSVDPPYADGSFSQSWDPYAYAGNNPCVRIDRDGRFWWFVAAAAIGGVVNVAQKYFTGQLKGWKDVGSAFGVGALAGVAGSLAGAWAYGAVGIGGFVGGAASGGIGSFVGLEVESYGNHAAFNDPYLSDKEILYGTLLGTAAGGLLNGSLSAYKGCDFWTGRKTFPKNVNLDWDRVPKGNYVYEDGERSLSKAEFENLVEELKRGLKPLEREGQECVSFISDGEYGLQFRVETHAGVNESFPSLNIDETVRVRHANVQLFKYDPITRRYKIPVFIPGQSQTNVHILLEEKFLK